MINYMSDSLSRLVEAVRSAGVDIAPGYCEYVRLAFAIANDCGEAGREGFIALCSLSVKFNREKAERLFSNSLKKGDHRIHLGTAFHLPNWRAYAWSLQAAPAIRTQVMQVMQIMQHLFPTHVRAIIM